MIGRERGSFLAYISNLSLLLSPKPFKHCVVVINCLLHHRKVGTVNFAIAYVLSSSRCICSYWKSLKKEHEIWEICPNCRLVGYFGVIIFKKIIWTKMCKVGRSDIDAHTYNCRELISRCPNYFFSR